MTNNAIKTFARGKLFYAETIYHLHTPEKFREVLELCDVLEAAGDRNAMNLSRALIQQSQRYSPGRIAVPNGMVKDAKVTLKKAWADNDKYRAAGEGIVELLKQFRGATTGDVVKRLCLLSLVENEPRPLMTDPQD